MAEESGTDTGKWGCTEVHLPKCEHLPQYQYIDAIPEHNVYQTTCALCEIDRLKRRVAELEAEREGWLAALDSIVTLVGSAKGNLEATLREAIERRKANRKEANLKESSVV